MVNRDNINLKLILSFGNKYQQLHEKGEITADELDRVLSLIDEYDAYETEEFAKKLNDIFND